MVQSSSNRCVQFSLCAGAAESLFVEVLVNELALDNEQISPSIGASAAQVMCQSTSLPRSVHHVSVFFVLFNGCEKKNVTKKCVRPIIVLTFAGNMSQKYLGEAQMRMWSGQCSETVCAQ